MILISVPHGYCESLPKERHCDRLAKKASYALSASFSEKQIKSVIFFPSTLRSFCDLNRAECLDTNYREKLSKFAKENHKEITFTLDVHSFPPDAERWENYDLVILDNLSFIIEKKGEFTEYALSLYRFCKKKGIAVSLWEGNHNSIQDEFRARGFKNLLLEFNEGLSDFDLKRITDVIVEWYGNEYGNPVVEERNK